MTDGVNRDAPIKQAVDEAVHPPRLPDCSVL